MKVLFGGKRVMFSVCTIQGYTRDATVRRLTVDGMVIAENRLLNCKPVNRSFQSFSNTKSVTVPFTLRCCYYITILLYQSTVYLRAIPDSDIVVGTNCVIYNYTFISMIRHTNCPIHIHQSSLIFNQTMIKLFDIRYAQNYILDEDVM